MSSKPKKVAKNVVKDLPEIKICTTAGKLIKELSRLPPGTPVYVTADSLGEPSPGTPYYDPGITCYPDARSRCFIIHPCGTYPVDQDIG